MAITTPTDISAARIADVSSTLRFLGDPTRLKIIASMAESERCVCDLTDQLGLSQPLVSWHLGKLRDAGLVRSRREGTWVYYSLTPEAWATTLAPLRVLLDLGNLPLEAAPDGREPC